MFSTQNVGKKIASLRKAADMTQMELADAIGVSYQAVSNWERGNSMPDISKLPELSRLLGCEIGDILDDKSGSALVEHVLDGTAEAYVKSGEATMEDVKAAVPVLRPKQVKAVVEAAEESGKGGIKIADLVSLAPFLDDEYLDALVDKVDVESIAEFAPLAPFLSDEALIRLAQKVPAGSLSLLPAIAPFLPEEALDELALRFGTDSVAELACLAPFLSEEALSRIVCAAVKDGKAGDCAALYPFLDDDALHALADAAIESGDISWLKKLAKFL